MNQQSRIHHPPPHLAAAGRAFWRGTLKTFELDAAELAILETACSALDRMAAARAIVAVEGVTVKTPRGIVSVHPAITVELSAGRAFRQSLKLLGLPTEAAEQPRSLRGQFTSIPGRQIS